MKERSYVQEMLHRKAEAFHRISEMGEEWELTPLLWACGTRGGGRAVNMNGKRRRLGGFWRIDKKFRVWAVGLQLSTGHPESAKEKGMEREKSMNHELWMAIKTSMPWAALSASPSPAAWVEAAQYLAFSTQFPRGIHAIHCSHLPSNYAPVAIKHI